MATRQKTTRFVLLPTRGLRVADPSTSVTAAAFLRQLAPEMAPAEAAAVAAQTGLPGASRFDVIDSIPRDGAKLVEMSADVANQFRAHYPGLRIIPEVFTFEPASFRH